MLFRSEVRDEVTRALEETPIGEQMKQQVIERRESVRRAVADRLKRAEAESAAAFPKLNARRDAAARKLAQAQAALEAAKAEHDAALSEVSTANYRIQHTRAQVHAALRENADPAIDVFLEELAELEQGACTGIQRDTAFKLNPYTDTYHTTTDTNYPSIVARVSAIRDARKAAHALKLEVGVDVASRIDELRATIPGVEFVRFEGTGLSAVDRAVGAPAYARRV